MRPKRTGLRLGTLCALLCIAFGTSCSSTVSSRPSAPYGPLPTRPSVLQPGSVVEVKFYYTPELNDVQTVRPDGMVQLQLIGPVQAAGQTPDTLREDLLLRYSEHLRNPEVSVNVQLFADQYVLVGGSVRLPQAVQMPGSMTALDAVMLAGGPDMREAHLEDVLIVRSVDGQRIGMRADLTPAFAGQAYDPVFLQPQDIVFVPRTRVVKMADWIDSHITKLAPFLRVDRRIGATTFGYDGSAIRF